jgi:hypothetical protein
MVACPSGGPELPYKKMYLRGLFSGAGLQKPEDGRTSAIISEDDGRFPYIKAARKGCLLVKMYRLKGVDQELDILLCSP